MYFMHSNSTRKCRHSVFMIRLVREDYEQNFLDLRFSQRWMWIEMVPEWHVV